MRKFATCPDNLSKDRRNVEVYQRAVLLNLFTQLNQLKTHRVYYLLKCVLLFLPSVTTTKMFQSRVDVHFICSCIKKVSNVELFMKF